MFSDDLMEAMMEKTVTPEIIDAAVREAAIGRHITSSVFMGSAYKNCGVQQMLDGVRAYLPSPHEVENEALDLDNVEASITLSSDTDKPFVGLAFKLKDGRYGQLT